MIVCINWILAQLIQVYLKENPELEVTLPRLSIQPLRPLVEEFEDGSTLVLVHKLPLTSQLLIALFHFYPKRVKYDVLEKSVPNISRRLVRNYLHRFKKKRLVHVNEGELFSLNEA